MAIVQRVLKEMAQKVEEPVGVVLMVGYYLMAANHSTMEQKYSVQFPAQAIQEL
jgi:hypothetical protein